MTAINKKPAKILASKATKYAGELAGPAYEPIILDILGDLGGHLTSQTQRRAVERQGLKFEALFKWHAVDPNSPNRWMSLAIVLALTHVPGLQVVYEHIQTSRRMRWFAVSACLFFGGCAHKGYVPPSSAPSPSVAIEGAKAAANDAKFVGSVEVSAVREAHPLGPGHHLLCIRGTDAMGLRTYAVFFESNKYITLRTSVSLDNCETQPFSPLGSGPFPSAH